MTYFYSTMWDGGLWWLVALVPFLIILTIWSLFWKAWALWIAARQGQKIWFGALLVVNTAGILEIIYIFWASKLNASAFQAPPVENGAKLPENKN